MALFGVGRGRARDKEAVPGPEVLAPRRSLDGWTLEGTALARRFGREELRELATLMHGVSAGMETPWTYERAADLLERGGERPQALAVLDAYFTLPTHIRDANAVHTRTLGRRRQRLRKRLGTPPPRGSATEEAVELAEPLESEAIPGTPASEPPVEPPAAPAEVDEPAVIPPRPAERPPVPAPIPPKPTEPPPVNHKADADDAAELTPLLANRTADKADGGDQPEATPELPPKPTTPPPLPIPPRPTRSALPIPPPEGRR
ncbi:MAG: hypothetical protein HOV68_05770 [Streptomycetaceae bacterium]|nr:hypothetical protein [Streptomycetaceae bacterium]